MPGGLLNLVSYGNQNVFLNGNPSKTLFKCTYAKYTNFGLQKFRLDFDGLRTLRLNESSQFSFRVQRYAELLMDTYLVVNLPTIWSPILPPADCATGQWCPYEFKWIDNLGTQLIQSVTFTVGGQIIQKFSGQYLYNLVERDFHTARKQTYYNMTGHVAALNDPANAFGRQNQYPNAYVTTNPLGSEPSIRSRQLFVPLNIWFTLAAKMAFPLVSLQYNELYIEVTLRPITELFVVRDVRNPPTLEYIQANPNDTLFQFYRFLQPPPNVQLDYTNADKRTIWNADVHLVSTYAFLSDDESKVFASEDQRFLIKQVYDYSFPNVTGSKKVALESLSMVANWMWFFQRSDVSLRNQWSNYSNWPYSGQLPSNVIQPSSYNVPTITVGNCGNYAPDFNPYNGAATGLVVAGDYAVTNQCDIMQTWAFLLDGKYRETNFTAGIFNYVEKYARSQGNSPDGLYCYNFGLNTSPTDFQPSGAMNMSKFKNIEFEFTTFQPPLDPSAQVFVICNPEGGEVIGINKPTWRIYDYNYDLTVLEERYNVLTFTSGNAGLMYAR
jgi:hypothetical protein